MAQTLTSARPKILEFTLGSANVLTQLNLPANAGSGRLSVSMSGAGYFCYEGADGATRSTEPRMPLPANAIVEMDRLSVPKILFAGNTGGESVHVHYGEISPVTVRD